MKGRSSLLRVGATYRLGLFAGSTLGHCGRRALTVPTRWMTPPSIIIPRSATELKKAKQLNGTASASNKSTFMPNVSVSGSLASPPNCILAVRQTKASRRLDDLALFVGGRVGRHAPAWAFLLTGLCCDNCSRLIWLSPL